MTFNKSKGYILLITILAIGALFFFAFALVRFQAADKKLAQKGENKVIAEQAAIAGVEQSILELKKNITWKTGFNKVELSHSKATYSVSFDKTQTLIPYSTINYLSSSSTVGYGGRVVPKGFIHIVSTGEYAGTKVIQQAFISVGGQYFREALFGTDKISLSGTITIDSYNSLDGTYAMTQQKTGGDLGTNASAAGAVELKNVSIYGTLRVGPGGSEATTLKITGQPYYQSFEVMQEAFPIQNITVPSTGTNYGSVTVASKEYKLIPPGTYSSLNLKGGTIEMTPGTYVVTGNIDLASGGSLLVKNGPVKIYVLGNITASAGSSFANETQRSSNLIIYGGPNPQNFNMQGLSGGFLSFSMYAPNAILSFGGGSEFFGSFVAKELYVSGNSNFHYDAALPGDSGSTPTVKVRW